MCFKALSLNNKPGFLIMEALLALLLFSGFSVVIGMYWQHLVCHQKNAEMQLQALSYATDMIDLVLRRQKYPAQINKFTVKIDKQIMVSPTVLKGAWKNPDVVQLVQVTVANKSCNVQLATILQEPV